MGNQTWPLIKEDYTTPLKHKPSMPLTTLQKRWLKALLSDPRIQLFDPPMEGLEDVEPLYSPDSRTDTPVYLAAASQIKLVPAQQERMRSQ